MSENIVQKIDNTVFTQMMITNLVGQVEINLEQQNIKTGTINNILTIIIELSQNIMNYAKSDDESDNNIVYSVGTIILSQDDTSYHISTKNVLSNVDVTKIMPKLIDITTLDKDEIKQKYKELRRSGKDTHDKGGGLGFYEIAKRCDKVEYHFETINSDKQYFYIKTTNLIN